MKKKDPMEVTHPHVAHESKADYQPSYVRVVVKSCHPPMQCISCSLRDDCDIFSRRPLGSQEMDSLMDILKNCTQVEFSARTLIQSLSLLGKKPSCYPQDCSDCLIYNDCEYLYFGRERKD